MHIRDFSLINKKRCEEGFSHRVEDWSLSDWATATAGELGEACNIIKKLNRIRDDIPNNKGEDEITLAHQLKGELADTYTYLDLLATAAGIDLQEAVITKFNEVSNRRDCAIKITDPTHFR